MRSLVVALIAKIAAAQAEGFRKVNDTIREGGDSYFRYRLIELLPQLTPAIAEALAKAGLLEHDPALKAYHGTSPENLRRFLLYVRARHLGGGGDVQGEARHERQPQPDARGTGTR